MPCSDSMWLFTWVGLALIVGPIATLYIMWAIQLYHKKLGHINKHEKF